MANKTGTVRPSMTGRGHLHPGLRERGLPADLNKILRPEGTIPPTDDPAQAMRDQWLQQINDNVEIQTELQAIGVAFTARPVTITTTPTQIVDGKFARGYIFLNPTPVNSLTGSGAVLASTAVAALGSGNTQANPLGVASFLNLTLFLNITAGTSTITINAQSQDPVSLNWVTTQTPFNLVSGVGTYYASLGALGVDTSFAISYTAGAGTGVTFSVGYVLKNGLPGGTTGVSNAVFLGNGGVTTTSGFPLLEGQTRTFYFRPNVRLFGVSNAASGVTISVFELQ